jgi:transposase
MPCVFKPLTQICTFKALKPCRKHFRRVWLHNNFAEILLQHNSAWAHKSLKTQEAIIKLRWTVLPHPPYCPDLIPSHFQLFQALKGVLHEKKFGSYDKFIEEVMKWLLNIKFRLVQEDDRCCCSWLLQGCWCWWTLCRKMRCVTHPMSLFKELYIYYWH